jgi:hypothetical protein
VGRSRLAHPIFTGAVAILAVNDRLLKPLVGSWWTGKLSDLSGVFVVAVLAGVVSHRPRAPVRLALPQVGSPVGSPRQLDV